MVHGCQDVPYQYRQHQTIIPSVGGWHCPKCHEVEFDQGEGDRFNNAIRQFSEQIDVQEAANLLRIRKKLKLTQKKAGLITGGGPNAFSRYELGKAKPLPAVIHLFNLLDRHPHLLKEISP
jgi:HTH-type transcriptional regulator/antitoxin MqsA